ncbi:Flp pilus assembly protein CpaB [Xanthomonas translucens]|uniref:Flp pilus assembly protein CpaB n=2 Tax=Xanthomonas campestris pv. translucens TaxID=343 RepID=A0A120EUX4_XANCT|nr:Flp pilus assembly protein CpaB [Xanthomonas translucens]KWV10416.1 Flp pilus assembly protein CpaB [Xanthomonas translucens]QSQ33588.1 Flp pilus assembly protein CpaB [Xanthomonas translucens pv. translucens]
MQKPKLSKNVLFILIAVVMAGLAAFIAVSYIRTTVAERTQDNRPMVDVAVPVNDLPQGTILQGSDLALRTVPAEFAPADAVTPDNHAQFEGRMLRAPARGGAPLSASALVPLYDQFSRLIPKGKVAYTMSVDENNSISGMIAPGDLIDLFFVKDATTGGSGGAGTGAQVFPLLQKIKVLAAGSRIGEAPTPKEGEESNTSTGFSSVTLELDQYQAKQLAVASKVGAVRVLLREVQDTSPGAAAGMSESQLLRLLGSGDPANTGSGSSRVEFIIGGKG